MRHADGGSGGRSIWIQRDFAKEELRAVGEVERVSAQDFDPVETWQWGTVWVRQEGIGDYDGGATAQDIDGPDHAFEGVGRENVGGVERGDSVDQKCIWEGGSKIDLWIFGGPGVGE